MAKTTNITNAATLKKNISYKIVSEPILGGIISKQHICDSQILGYSLHIKTSEIPNVLFINGKRIEL